LSRLFGDVPEPEDNEKFRWVPTQADLHALQKIVNDRAGRVLINVETNAETRADESQAEAEQPTAQADEVKDAAPAKSRNLPMGTPRPFVAANIPAPLTPSGSRKPVEETIARSDKANQNHHALVAALQRSLEATGWTDIQEVPGSVDLWARNPAAGCRVIFEAKTLDAASERDQTRAAFAQLLEYRYFRGEREDKLCLVTNAPISNPREQFLATYGIAVLAYDGKAFHSSGPLAREWFGEQAFAVS